MEQQITSSDGFGLQQAVSAYREKSKRSVSSSCVIGEQANRQPTDQPTTQQRHTATEQMPAQKNRHSF